MVQDFSIWEYEAYHRSWDICIVGSGITGLSTGISILESRPELNVLIVDRWFIPLGASTRNAGFSCFGSPSEILDDISSMGEDAALSLVKMRWNGLQLLQKRLENSNAQYESNGGYELYHSEEFENIHSQLPYLNQFMEHATGIAEVFHSSQIPSGIRGFSNAIYNPHEGQLHPGFMIEHLKQKYLDLGGRLITGLQIDKIEEAGDRVYLRSKVAIPIESKQVIVTTNAFAAELLPDLDVHGARNLVLATQPIEGLTWKGCFHFEKGFYYFRNIGKRILLGGARNTDFLNEDTEDFGTNPRILQALENFLFTHLADRNTCTVDYQWSGIIAVGNQKLPIIRSISPRLFVGVRCSGMGIALASVIGEDLKDLVLQQYE